jgi:predicted DNA-binding transcriptional regulator AlpA
MAMTDVEHQLQSFLDAKIEKTLAEHLLRSNPPRVMTTSECARYLSVSRDRLFQMRREGVGPKYCQPTERWVRYRVEDVDAWVSGQ